MNRERILRRRIKLLTWLFIIGLALSGATAIPLPGELNLLVNFIGADGKSSEWVRWLLRVQDALAQTQAQHPFLFYGTDWLAFGHFVIAIAFIGALRDPIRNRWLFDFGMIACVLVIPYALVFGGLRGIPFWWRLIDCSFGVFGFIPLWFCRKWTSELEQRAKARQIAPFDMSISMKSRMKRILTGLAAMMIAAILWLPCLHLIFTRPLSDFRQNQGLSLKARQLAAWQLQLWTEPALREHELKKMRVSNAEWDFMGRSYLVWSLANMALREPASKPLYLQTMDQIIDETLRLEKQKGMYFFLMPYARDGRYVMQPAHSLFLDGEIALMLASRRVVEEKPEYKLLLTERVNAMVERFQKSPRMMLESYPDECWTFDHCVALDAIKMADYLDGSDHSALIHDWIAMAKQKLVDRESGLLISSFLTDGTPLHGPEGSTIWMVAHSLQLLDDDFARDQYQRARKQLGEITLGFGYAHEWPKSWKGEADIDSGPIIPGFDISAGSSGMAFIGASTFGDEQFLTSLAATLDFAAFPARTNGRLKYCASNQVGDAALLYAATLGPLWEKVKTGAKR